MRSTGPGWARERAGNGPGQSRPPRRRTRRPVGDAWVVVGESASEPWAAKGEAATVLLAAVGEATAGVAVGAAGAAIPAAVEETRADHGAGQRGDSRPGGEDGRAAGRSDHGSGQRDPGRSRSGAERASKPGGEDGAAVEVTAEVGASMPITAGDVVSRAGHGPGRASVPITAGTRGPGRARPGDELRRVPASRPKHPCSERRGTARALRAKVNVHGWGRGGMREGMEGLKFRVPSVSSGQRCDLHLADYD